MTLSCPSLVPPSHVHTAWLLTILKNLLQTTITTRDFQVCDWVSSVESRHNLYQFMTKPLLELITCLPLAKVRLPALPPAVHSTTVKLSSQSRAVDSDQWLLPPRSPQFASDTHQKQTFEEKPTTSPSHDASWVNLKANVPSRGQWCTVIIPSSTVILRLSFCWQQVLYSQTKKIRDCTCTWWWWIIPSSLLPLMQTVHNFTQLYIAAQQTDNQQNQTCIGSHADAQFLQWEVQSTSQQAPKLGPEHHDTSGLSKSTWTLKMRTPWVCKRVTHVFIDCRNHAGRHAISATKTLHLVAFL